MMDCKRALQEKNGDIEAAVDYLREKGIAKAATKASRIAAEGLTNVKFCDKCHKGIIVEVNCETDFVSSSDKFHKLVDDVTSLLLKEEPKDIEAAKAKGNGKYDIAGTAGGQAVVCHLTILEKNFLSNYGFEDGVLTPWTLTLNGASASDNYIAKVTKENPQTGSYNFNFWAKDADTMNFDLEQAVSLSASGTYKFQASTMGLHDITTMNEVTSAAKAINPSIAIYGEPWTGGTTTLKEAEQAKQVNGNSFVGYGQFNDQMRDGLIKGGLSGDKDLGWVTNTTSSIETLDANRILNGVKGTTFSGSVTIADPDKTTNYVTCHDNYTLADRIAATKTAVSSDAATVAKMNVLANSVVFTSEGTSFMLFVTGPYLLTSFIGNMNNFNVIYLLTGGGPTNGAVSAASGSVGYTDLLITWLYKITMGANSEYYMASVIGILVFVVSAVLSMIVYNFMICLNPYVSKLDLPVGIGTGNAYNGSYPYIIQANYRAGYFTHYAGQGTLKSAVVRRGGEEVDLALERTMASYSKVGEDILLTTDPFDVVFKDLTVKMRSRYLFKKGTGEIITTREILSDLKGETIEIEDYLVGCYGINEYSDDMSGITLEVEGQKKKSLVYAYKMRSIELEGTARAIIPQVKTTLEMGSDAPKSLGRVEEGIAFSPMFRLSEKKTFTAKGEFTT